MLHKSLKLTKRSSKILECVPNERTKDTGKNQGSGTILPKGTSTKESRFVWRIDGLAQGAVCPSGRHLECHRTGNNGPGRYESLHDDLHMQQQLDGSGLLVLQSLQSDESVHVDWRSFSKPDTS
ncbi:hypothetical protein TNCV_3628491 [Trichonephila clavipes]|nr:hypothetical protein TNCV_3628491 [Trichonephila clavipes]